MTSSRKPRIGLALGGGAARGWAHVGVIRALEAAGIKPDLVCGTSIGALVGAAYAAGELDRFEQWLLELGFSDVLSFLDVRMSGGMIKGNRLMEFFGRSYGDGPIEDLPMPFGAIATELGNGAEIWMREGSVLDAVRASIALPGLFAPVIRDDRLLVDGGLVNPVPVSLARAMGADIVIAVDLSADILGRHLKEAAEAEDLSEETATWRRKLQESLDAILPAERNTEPRLPSMLDVIASSITIMQVRITRSRMAGDPPDLVVTPRLAHMGLFDFHLAREGIEEGKRATEAVLANLQTILQPGSPTRRTGRGRRK